MFKKRGIPVKALASLGGNICFEVAAFKISWVLLWPLVSLARVMSHVRKKESGQGVSTFMFLGYLMVLHSLLLVQQRISPAPFPPLFLQLLAPLNSKPQLLKKEWIIPKSSHRLRGVRIPFLQTLVSHYHNSYPLRLFDIISSKNFSFKDNKHMFLLSTSEQGRYATWLQLHWG